MKKAHSWGSLSVILSMFFALLAGWATASAGAVRRFEMKPCHVEGIADEVRCGIYEVYENRAAASGRRIPLKVIVMPATGSPRQPDPVVFFAGGPGGSITDSAAFYAERFRELRKSRDLVFVDVRGTGGSQPLICDQMTGDQGVQRFLDDFLPASSVKACRDQYSGIVDLTHYTTDEAVDDVDEACRALGYPKVNLHGESYGTRAALVYIRRHPGRVRSAVLEGTVPLDARMPITFARDAQEALSGLFAECEGDEGCRGAFPTVREEFEKVLTTLEAEPVETAIKDNETQTSITLRLTRNGFAQTIRYMLYGPRQASKIPLFVHEAANGNFVPISAMAYALSKALGGSLIADGYYLCVTCSEDVPWIADEEISAAVQGTFLGDFRIHKQKAACAEWPVAKVAPGYLEPVRSDVPVLIISGERDPATPARNGDEVAKSLPRSRHIVVSDCGHWSYEMKGAECFDQIVAAFIEAGRADALDVSCLERVERPPFLLSIPSTTSAPGQ